MLSPRRTIAVGLALIACGVAIFLIGGAVAFWRATSLMARFEAEELPMLVSKMGDSQQIVTIAQCAGGAPALLGIGLMTVGAIRWLWGENTGHLQVSAGGTT